MKLIESDQYITDQGLDPKEVWTAEYVKGLHDNLKKPKPKRKSKGLQQFLMSFLASCTSLLDVGCGFNPRRYKLPDLKMVGVDVSPEMIALGQKLHPEFTFIEGNVYDLPFDDNSFDAVQSFGMLRHMKKWESALQEMIRVAEKKLIFTHLIGNSVFKCGQYQWCTTNEKIERLLPYSIETRIIKSWVGFESILFLVELQ